MSLEEILGTLLEARIAPLHTELRRLATELVRLRRALPPMLVSLKEAAIRMRVSYATARRRAHTGEWPVRRDGGRILVDLTSLHPRSEAEIAHLARELEGLTGRTDDNGQA